MKTNADILLNFSVDIGIEKIIKYICSLGSLPSNIHIISSLVVFLGLIVTQFPWYTVITQVHIILFYTAVFYPVPL